MILACVCAYVCVCVRPPPRRLIFGGPVKGLQPYDTDIVQYSTVQYMEGEKTVASACSVVGL